MLSKTASQKTFRVVNEREGLSGGEHAVVSLVMMAAILSVNEEMNKESSKSRSESGGYLLLDEWDAALDPINSYSVFEILKRLNKKIISVTPRSNSQGYIKEFGIVIKVLNMSQIAILKEEEYDDMFTELKVAEQDKINQVL